MAETIWIRYGSEEDEDDNLQPRLFHVTVGSAEHEWLLKSGGEPVDADDAGERLEDLTRSELNDRALDAGVADPERLPNKDAVIDAIHDAETAE